MRVPSLLLLALGVAGGDEDAQPMGASQGIFQASDADLSTATTSAPTAAATIPPTATPTAKPTIRCRPGRPCLSPPAPAPTPAPTSSPLISSPIPLTVNLMVYVEDVPGRGMEDRDKEIYLEVMTDFLKANVELGRNGVHISRLAIFHHDLLVEEEGKTQKREQKQSRRGSLPLTEEQDAGDDPGRGFVYSYDTGSGNLPRTYPAALILTRVELSTKLPRTVAAFFLWDELRRGEAALVEAFYAKRFFNSYFDSVTHVASEVVERLTKRPTPAPTQIVAVDVEELATGESETSNYFIDAGIALLTLWLILSLCGWIQIHKYRKKSMRQGKMDRLQMGKFRRMNSIEEKPVCRRPDNVEANVAIQDADANSWSSHSSTTAPRETGGPKSSRAMALV